MSGQLLKMYGPSWFGLLVRFLRIRNWANVIILYHRAETDFLQGKKPLFVLLLSIKINLVQKKCVWGHARGWTECESREGTL